MPKRDFLSIVQTTGRMVDSTSVKLLDFNAIEIKKLDKTGQILDTDQRSYVLSSWFSHNSLIFRSITLLLLILSICFSFHTFLERMNIPTLDIIKFISVVLTSYLMGELFKKINLPNVVGMYSSGIILRNINYFNNFDHLRPWFITARYVAISVVLIRSGLSLDLSVIKKYPISVIKLSLIPSIAEAIAVAVAVKFLLPQDYPWLWAILFGFAVNAVSPTLTMKILCKLKSKETYANEKLCSIYASSSLIEDITSISCFAVVISTIIQTGSFLENILFSLMQLFLGFIVGSLWGYLSGCFPHKSDKHNVLKRIMMLFFGGICMYLGAKYAGVPAGGPLGCFMSGVVAAYCFKSQGWKQKNPVLTEVSNLWSWIMEPTLFAFVGIEIDTSTIKLWDSCLNIIVILLGSMTRCIIGIISLKGIDFNQNEKIFYVLSTLPKATVEAALGPQSFDIFNDSPDHEISLNILKTSVLSVIVITTISSIILKIFTSKLLIRSKNKTSV